ncbi:hypothetical protein [Negadavirga shengliensis]|uniref:Uncharacterized protein n=1 Tax=Negadavirga shengliensis TaxID=1389218 RepID=A0ABV9T545_9BACT
MKTGSVFSFLGILFCFLYSTELKAQSEGDLVLPGEIKSEHSYKDTTSPTQAVASEESASDYSPLNRDRNIPNEEKEQKPEYSQNREKQIKNEEMSTLSFNIFLYVLDRFREDK